MMRSLLAAHIWLCFDDGLSLHNQYFGGAFHGGSNTVHKIFDSTFSSNSAVSRTQAVLHPRFAM